MLFDTLVDMHMVTRAAFANRPLFGTKRDGAYQWLTYHDFGKQVDAARTALAALGIGRGDAVACIAANRVEWAVLAYATYSLGGAFVPMYEEQRVKDWRYIVENSDAKALFVSTEVRLIVVYTCIYFSLHRHHIARLHYAVQGLLLRALQYIRGLDVVKH